MMLFGQKFGVSYWYFICFQFLVYLFRTGAELGGLTSLIKVNYFLVVSTEKLISVGSGNQDFPLGEFIS